MKNWNLLLGLFLLIVFSCGKNKTIPPGEKSFTLDQLKTTEDKKEFLEQILQDDQKVRGPESSALILKYGQDSKELMAFVRAQWKQDSINLEKIAAYLERFGYPSQAKLGKDAAMAPWYVIHHSTDTGIRNQYFPTLYRAYLTGDLESTPFAMYLGRTYQLFHRSRFQIDSPFKPEDEINQLIEALDLESEKTKVLEHLNS